MRAHHVAGDEDRDHVQGGPARFRRRPPHTSWLSGYLDLQREAPHPTIRSVARYTKRLYVHHFRVTDFGQMDEAFAGLVAEAYAVGAGEHVLSGSPPGRSGHAERGMGGGARATS